jgi:hypothetical protein
LAQQRDDGHLVSSASSVPLTPPAGWIEHESTTVASLLLYRRALRQNSRSRAMPAAAASRSYIPENAGFTGEKASRARGMRASTSRHNARQRRDSFMPATNAPMTIVPSPMPSAVRWNGCSAAGAT